MQWDTIKFDANIKIIVKPRLSNFSHSVENDVDTIWLKKKTTYPELFNGRVFNVTELTSNKIIGFWIEYKYVLAQTEKPELYSQLNIRSLAVIGLIHCPEGFVLGKRTNKSVYLPGYWQSAPAGTVEDREGTNQVNLIEQLYAETHEELGLISKQMSNAKIISATEHTNTHIIDVGISLETKLSFDEIKSIWKLHDNPEYIELTCCSDYRHLPENTLPTTRFLVQNYFNQH